MNTKTSFNIYLFHFKNEFNVNQFKDDTDILPKQKRNENTENTNQGTLSTGFAHN